MIFVWDSFQQHAHVKHERHKMQYRTQLYYFNYKFSVMFLTSKNLYVDLKIV
jgi:hypothetical protein